MSAMTHDAVLAATDRGGKSVRELTQQLRDGEIRTDQWQLAMAVTLKDAHLAAAIAAKDGAPMTQSDYGRVGQIVRAEYGHLRDLANGIADGSIPLDGRVLQRAEQYLRAGRETYAVFDRLEHERAGMTEERNVLGSGEDNCDGCLDATAAGWSELGSLTLPGGRDCRHNCRCHLEYRSAA